MGTATQVVRILVIGTTWLYLRSRSLESIQNVAPNKAAIYAALGDHDQALDLLEQAAEQPTWQLRLLKATPTWDPLRQQARFQALLTNVGLSQ